MSALGQKQTFAVQNVMSALPRKADIVGATGMSAKGQQQSFRHSFDHGTTMEGTLSVTIRLTLH